MNLLDTYPDRVRALFSPIHCTVLYLPLKREYFEQIRDGQKSFEYRLCTRYWKTRLVGRHYSDVVLTMGYPPASDASRRLVRPYRGYHIETIAHPHFGPNPVEVFAIKVSA